MGRLLYDRPHLVHRFDLRLPPAWGAEVVTVHDLPPLRFSDEGRLPRSALVGARRARKVIVPSAFAAGELAELLGVTDAEIIPYGIGPDHRSSVPASDDDLRRLGIMRPFVLHAAGASQRKNLPGLAAAWRRIAARHADVHLVLCGPPHGRRTELFQGLERVVATGALDASTIASLMRRAQIVVVPSTYEGFGLPALEGMAAGTPVVAARRGALPEVCGNAALLVEPDGEAMAEGIEQLLVDEPLADSLRRLGPRRAAEFDWDTAARAHLRVYRSALE